MRQAALLTRRPEWKEPSKGKPKLTALLPRYPKQYKERGGSQLLQDKTQNSQMPIIQQVQPLRSTRILNFGLD